MKVLKIIEEGRIGGPQLDIVRVTPHLQPLGVKIAVVLPQCNSSDLQQLLAVSDIQFITAPLTTMRKHPKILFTYVLKFIPELFYLIMIIREKNPDLIHVSGGSWQIKGVLASLFTGHKVIWHLNDTQTPIVLKLLFRLVQPLAHGFITAGHRVNEYYLPYENKRPIFNISAPVDCSVFDPSLVQKTNTNDLLRIITVANINPIKDLKKFLEVAAILNNKIVEPLQFRIIGPVHDSQQKYFEQLKNHEKNLKLENIIFVGGVLDTRKELADADIYVCTSLAEASPTSVWEALAMGKPVVTTNVGEVDHIIEHEISGLICQSGEAKELAEKIEHLIFHKKISKKLGKYARDRATKLLDVTMIAKQHFQAYEETLNSK